MDQQTRDAVTFLLGTFLTACLIGGLITKWVLLPYLRDHIVAKVDETHRQVTQNHHTSDPPTLVDKLDDLKRELRGVASVVDQHLRWSWDWTENHERHHEELENGDENGTNPGTKPTL